MPRRPMIAMVALEQPSLPQPQIVRFLRDNWPDIAAQPEPHERPGVMTLAMGEDRGGLALVPRPLPWADLEGPCAVAWYWPQAAQSFRQHTAHLACTILPGGSDQVDCGLRLTALVAAASSASAALGVYWGPGRLVHAPEAFVAESRGMSRQNLPLNLWIDFRVQRDDDGTCSLFTTGLEAFGQREIEVHRSRREPQFMRDMAYNVAHYLLAKDAMLKQGETIGLAGGEQIPIDVGPSLWDERMMVVRLDL
jgi:hypothetical protein